MGPVQIIVTCTTLLVALMVGLFLYLRYKSQPTEADKLRAEDFLNGLRDHVLASIAEILKDFDYSSYTDFAQLEYDLITKVSDTCNGYIQEELAKSTDILSTMVLKVLQSGMIEEFVRQCMEHMKVDKAAEAVLADKIAEYQEIAIEMEAQYKAAYADPTKYVENPEDIVYEDPTPEVIPEEELNKLNPQRDEEESYNAEDDSMEIVEEIVEDNSDDNTIESADDIDEE